MAETTKRHPFLTFLLLVGLLALAIRLLYGGRGSDFPDRSGEPRLTGEAMEQVAALDEPPGNIAVSAQGRIFFTFHPEARPESTKVAELVNGKPVPYPDVMAQSDFVTPLGTRIDRQGRLWVIDPGFHGVKHARLYAFDLATNKLLLRHEFSSADAGIGSFFNDFQVSPDGRTVYIADINIFGKRPALVVFDVATGSARRLLQGQPSVTAGDWLIRAPGRDMLLLGGLLALRPGLDSIALDANGEWLYYGAMCNENLFRIKTRDLLDQGLTAEQLGQRVELYAAKPQTDGLSMDLDGNVYLTDPEHRGVAVLGTDRKLSTLIKDPRIRWADGLSFGPEGWLYIADSAIQDHLFKSKAYIRAHAPYFLWRVKPGPAGTPGQ
ncbi:MAG: L-dopachrome tautomerase-related protein [Acidobacteriota bacterium]